ncbi:MAG: riboflavin synthase [Dehalococcoidales bacterium]|nr:riboflavin synthase [Dehalococcoidales bacterium]
MFTGIIEEVGRVTSVQPESLVVAASKVLQGLELGGSVSVNGVCLTVTSFDTRSFSVGLMPETIERTNLGMLSIGEGVNLERPLTLGKPLGGHLVQGHIDSTGKVNSVTWDGDAMLVRLETPPKVISYIVEKGFIAVDGVSLTVVSFNDSSFVVSIVEYTRETPTWVAGGWVTWSIWRWTLLPSMWSGSASPTVPG